MVESRLRGPLTGLVTVVLVQFQHHGHVDDDFALEGFLVVDLEDFQVDLVDR